MRLTAIEKAAIIEAITSVDPDAQIYLFGSRTDDTQKGGDIDLLIFSQKITFGEKLKIKAAIFEKIDEQKIDLVITDNENDPFVKMVLEKGVVLK